MWEDQLKRENRGSWRWFGSQGLRGNGNQLMLLVEEFWQCLETVWIDNKNTRSEKKPRLHTKPEEFSSGIVHAKINNFITQCIMLHYVSHRFNLLIWSDKVIILNYSWSLWQKTPQCHRAYTASVIMTQLRIIILVTRQSKNSCVYFSPWCIIYLCIGNVFPW